MTDQPAPRPGLERMEPTDERRAIRALMDALDEARPELDAQPEHADRIQPVVSVLFCDVEALLAYVKYLEKQLDGKEA